MVALLERDKAECAEGDDQITRTVTGFGKPESSPGEREHLRELAEKCERIGEPCMRPDAQDIPHFVRCSSELAEKLNAPA
jgi:hypothetical protein